MINACICPKYYFQNDKYLFNIEDKASIDSILKEKKTKTALPVFTLLSVGDCTKHSSAQSCRVREVQWAARCTLWPTDQGKLLVILVLSLLQVVCHVSITLILGFVLKMKQCCSHRGEFWLAKSLRFCALIIQNCKLTWFSSWGIQQKWKLTCHKMLQKGWFLGLCFGSAQHCDSWDCLWTELKLLQT